MSDVPRLRRALFGRTASLVSTARSRRPLSTSAPRSQAPCPFCEGNESETEKEVFAHRRAGTAPDTPGWSLRVVPNKFPALLEGIRLPSVEHGPFDEAPAAGLHEVIIETQEHDRTPSRSTTAQLATLLTIYRDRLAVLSARPGVQSVVVIRNEGREAGASQPHPHSQVLALPMVHPRLADELRAANHHFEAEGRCLTCDMIRHELDGGRRIIAENDAFIAVASFAPRFPYELWIVPRTHGHDFKALGAIEIDRCAEILRQVLEALDSHLGAFPYNLVLLTSPVSGAGSAGESDVERSFHWRLELLPRITTPSGLELGCDVFIVSVSPEDAAAALRPLAKP